MFLTLIDGEENVFLALILLAAQGDKPVSEVLEEYIEADQFELLLRRIRLFAKAALTHPVLKLTREEMIRPLASYQEGKSEEGAGGR